ncbi:MAG TPA: response regulator [Burkholderiales bacterium]
MTPEETKTHVESRLRELGWSVLIGRAGYEKIARLTGDDRAGIERLCRKLISLGALQDQPRITDDMVELAMLDLDPAERQGTGRAAAYDPLPDLPSIEELAAKLDARANGGPDVEPSPPPRPVFRGVDAGEPPPRAPRLPKLLLVQPDAHRRAAFAAALSDAFAVIEAGDGVAAWRVLSEQNDVEMLVTDVDGPELDAYQLIRRVRESAAPALVGLPIIVIGEDRDEEGKMRLLRAGANDFVRRDIDPRELRGRAAARHRVSRDAMRVATARVPVRPTVGAAPAGAGRSPVTTLTAERPEGAALPQGAKSRAANSVTTKITVAATALLALGIAAVIYISRNYDELRLGELGLVLQPRTEGAPGTDTAGSSAEARPSESTRGEGAAPAEAQKPPERNVSESPPSKAASTEQPPRNVRDRTPIPRSEAPSASTPTNNGMAKPATPAPAAPSASVKRAERPRAGGAPGVAVSPEAARAPDSTAGTAPLRPPASAPAEIEAAERVPTAEELAKVTPPAVPAPPVRKETPRPEAVREEAPPSTASPSMRSSTPVAPRADGGARAREPSPDTPATAARPRSDAVPTPRQEPARTEPPVAAAPPAAVPQAPPPDRISRDELSSLLARFASVYGSGDLEQFMALFAPNARTNDRTDPAGIRRDYESLFRTTDLREMQLGEISWEVDGNQAQGWGEFNVSVRRRGDSEIFRYAGSLTMVVEKIDGRLRIVRLYHGQRRIEAAAR